MVKAYEKPGRDPEIDELYRAVARWESEGFISTPSAYLDKIAGLLQAERARGFEVTWEINEVRAHADRLRAMLPGYKPPKGDIVPRVPVLSITHRPNVGRR